LATSALFPDVERPDAEAQREAPSAQASGRTKMRAAGLSKTYGNTVALHPIDLEVQSGELLTLLGPSGSGKTTLLQIVSGLVEPSAGHLYIDDVDRTRTAAHERDIGVVFQHYALFPHLTVFENIAFPLQMRRVAAVSIRAKVSNALEMVGLGPYGTRYPRELSGGQQQRVALARCLVYQPSLLLMDESLSALDRKLRETMQVEIKRIHRETGTTIIFVTHDQEEALALSDRVCLMNAGRIEQIGSPEAIYEHPNNVFVADFIGISNKLTGTVDAAHRLHTADGVIPLPNAMRGTSVMNDSSGTHVARQLSDYKAADDEHTAQIETPPTAVIIVRPEHISLVDKTRESSNGYLSGQIIERIYTGAETRLMVRLPSGTVMTVRQPSGSARVVLGDHVSLYWHPEYARVLYA